MDSKAKRRLPKKENYGPEPVVSVDTQILKDQKTKLHREEETIHPRLWAPSQTCEAGSMSAVRYFRGIKNKMMGSSQQTEKRHLMKFNTLL